MIELGNLPETQYADMLLKACVDNGLGLNIGKANYMEVSRH